MMQKNRIGLPIHSDASECFGMQKLHEVHEDFSYKILDAKISKIYVIIDYFNGLIDFLLFNSKISRILHQCSNLII